MNFLNSSIKIMYKLKTYVQMGVGGHSIMMMVLSIWIMCTIHC